MVNKCFFTSTQKCLFRNLQTLYFSVTEGGKTLGHVAVWWQSERGHALTSSVLYMPIPQPPAGKSYTSHSLALLPSAGEKMILNFPGWSTTKSVALYCVQSTAASVNMEASRQRSFCGTGGGGTAVPSHLITERVPSDGDGLRPARNEPGNVLADDWLAEDRASQDVPDGAVGALPHLLQVKL